MKVTIVNCYHDSNKGSCAILWGLIRRLRQTGLVKSISLVSMFQKDHPFYESSLRHIKAESLKSSLLVQRFRVVMNVLQKDIGKSERSEDL